MYGTIESFVHLLLLHQRNSKTKNRLKMQLADKYGIFYGGITNSRTFAKPQPIKGAHSHGQISNFYVGRSTEREYVCKERLCHSTAPLHAIHPL